MRGRFYLDGRDAYDEFGMWVEQSGYNGLLQLSPFKTLDTTSWPDDDGDEVDLTEVHLDARSFQMTFGITDVRFAEDFFDTLSDGAVHCFTFPELRATEGGVGRSYYLRMSQNGTFKQNVRLGRLTLTFCADSGTGASVAYPYAYGLSDVTTMGYELDGTDLSQFGTWVTEGTDESLRKAPSVKDNLKVGNKMMAGVLYDGEDVRFKAKDVTLKLFIRCDSVGEFWRRYDSLFHALMQPGLHTFCWPAFDAEYDCYYKSMAVRRFDITPKGIVWCEFDVTLTFTSARPMGQYRLLASESWDYITTEDGRPIIVRPKAGIAFLVSQDGRYVATEANDRIFFNQLS